VRILVTGSTGQVGRSLVPALSRLGEVIALDRATCDLSDLAAINRALHAVQPDVIVNPAAYTAVDKAETERNAAFAVNSRAPGMLAQLAAERGVPLIHYSTDYVYDGRKPTPYVEDDPTNPLSVYGTSKLDGEEEIRANLQRHVILRTSWVFSEHGTNFLKTMLRLGMERDTLNVVADQIGAPTPAHFIAQATATIIQRLQQGDAPFGTYHLASAGQTSWHGYAEFLLTNARRLGIPLKVNVINPIPAAAYPVPAVRPANSRLDTSKLARDFAITPPPWQDGVVQVLERLSAS